MNCGQFGTRRKKKATDKTVKLRSGEADAKATPPKHHLIWSGPNDVPFMTAVLICILACGSSDHTPGVTVRSRPNRHLTRVAPVTRQTIVTVVPSPLSSNTHERRPSTSSKPRRNVPTTREVSDLSLSAPDHYSYHKSALQYKLTSSAVPLIHFGGWGASLLNGVCLPTAVCASCNSWWCVMLWRVTRTNTPFVYLAPRGLCLDPRGLTGLHTAF